MRPRQGFRPGVRGGLADRPIPRPQPPAPGGPAPQGRAPAPGLGAEIRRLVRGADWTAVFVGFLAYVGVITTYALQIGDLAVVVSLLGLVFLRQPARLTPLLGTFLIFLLWCAAGYLYSAYPEVVQEETINLAKLGLIMLAGVNALRTRGQIRFFIIFWLACFALYPMRGTYVNYFIGGYRVAGRAIWNNIYENPNDLAALTILQLSMCLGVVITEPKGWMRRVALLGVPLLILLIFLTQSRGGILGLVTFGLFAFVGHRRRLRALAMVLIIGLVVALAAPSSVWERLGGLTQATDTENLGAIEDEGSAQQRYEIWQTAMKIIDDSPIVGVGWGAYPQANAYYAPLSGGGEFELGARDAHSTYLRTVAEIGFPGFFIFCSVILCSVMFTERVRRRIRTHDPGAAQQLYLLEVGLLGFMVSGIFGSFSRLSFLYLHLVLMYALASAYGAQLRSSRRPPSMAAWDRASPARR